MASKKFRIWDSKNKEMVYSSHSRVEPDGDIQVFYPWGFALRNNFGCHAGFITIMQYTGLNDKKGKEIYEGDIIKEDSYPYTRGEVKHDDGAFYISGYTELCHACVEHFWEVIGNIYENLDLLKSGK